MAWSITGISHKGAIGIIAPICFSPFNWQMQKGKFSVYSKSHGPK